MEKIAPARRVGRDEHELHLQLLVADDDALARSQLVACMADNVGEIAVLEAEDGAEAIQLGLQQSPDIALLDINLPRLGGIEAAITLRELRPRIRLGLQTGDPLTHRERAHEHGIPVFDKLELDHTVSWLQAQARWCIEAQLEPEVPRKRSFLCGACGYGALRAAAPDRCPMCHVENAWVEAPWRPSRILVSG